MHFPTLEIKEKRMFSGLAFLVNGKMCVYTRGQDLMWRFDPTLTGELAEKPWVLRMIMKGKEYKGYCYFDTALIRMKKDFEFWINLCLDFNDIAKKSKKRSKNSSNNMNRRYE